jgi:hypothetical protein
MQVGFFVANQDVILMIFCGFASAGMHRIAHQQQSIHGIASCQCHSLSNTEEPHIGISPPWQFSRFSASDPIAPLVSGCHFCLYWLWAYYETLQKICGGHGVIKRSILDPFSCIQVEVNLKRSSGSTYEWATLSKSPMGIISLLICCSCHRAQLMVSVMSRP